MTLYVSLCMCLINVYLKGLEALSANKAFCMVQISIGINHLGIIFQNLSTKVAASWHRVWLKCFQLLYVFILQCRMQIQEPCWKKIPFPKKYLRKLASTSMQSGDVVPPPLSVSIIDGVGVFLGGNSGGFSRREGLEQISFLPSVFFTEQCSAEDV